MIFFYILKCIFHMNSFDFSYGTRTSQAKCISSIAHTLNPINEIHKKNTVIEAKKKIPHIILSIHLTVK